MVEPKFNLEDEVYHTTIKYETFPPPKCKTCKGKGTIGKPCPTCERAFACPDCRLTSHFVENKRVMVVQGPYHIIGINIDICIDQNEGTDIIYRFESNELSVDESKLYATKEEAEAVCKAFNDEQPTEPEFGLRSLAKKILLPR